MKNYKFSASTSFFKRGDFVEQIYQQLLNQTHTNWEWIVTDDFSTEKNAEAKLREICAKDPRVKYFDQKFKMQLFYNPQLGCTGDIILQTDSDDIISPKLMEQYNYWFNKRPDVYGMSCSYATKEDINYPSLVGKWITESNYDLKKQTQIESMTMGRAWRNVIPHFESDGFKWYQNDTNILRHVENVGKWFWIPRVLYWYNHTPDSFSKAPYTKQQQIEIEEERQIIENRFPKLLNREECTFVTDYLPILDKFAVFYESDDVHFAKNKQSVNYIDPNIQTWEKQLIREIYWDFNLEFNDFESGQHYDDLIMNLTPENWGDLDLIISKLKIHYPKQMFRMFAKTKHFGNSEFDTKFGFYIWNITEDEGFVKIYL
jgi:glycosyltransferase involved in cell wall biosynthesis